LFCVEGVAVNDPPSAHRQPTGAALILNKLMQ
jgi:hypothetical protein